MVVARGLIAGQGQVLGRRSEVRKVNACLASIRSLGVKLVWRPRLLEVLVVGLCCSCGGVFGGGSSTQAPSDDTITAESTLYQRLGGVDVLRVIVDEWLVIASSDERIRDFFANTDISRLKLRLVERICVQVQGPCLYRGRGMYAAHSNLGIEDSHLRAFLEGLEPAMLRAGIKGEAADQLRSAIRGLAEELAIAVVR